jgi:hypothetical protein
METDRTRARTIHVCFAALLSLTALGCGAPEEAPPVAETLTAAATAEDVAGAPRAAEAAGAQATCGGAVCRRGEICCGGHCKQHVNEHTFCVPDGRNDQ